MTSRRRRRAGLGLLYAAYLGYLLLVTLSPGGGLGGRGVRWTMAAAELLGQGWVTESLVEKGLNVVLFVPLGLLGVPLFPRVPWPAWAGLGLALSGFVEGFQALFLPERYPTVSDLVTNTAGALLGAAAAVVLGRLRAPATMTVTSATEDREGGRR